MEGGKLRRWEDEKVRRKEGAFGRWRLEVGGKKGQRLKAKS